MGYAQLSEGRVEKLNVLEELERAIAQVFPAAMPDKVKIHRKFDHHFPPIAHATRSFVGGACELAAKCA